MYRCVEDSIASRAGGSVGGKTWRGLSLKSNNYEVGKGSRRTRAFSTPRRRLVSTSAFIRTSRPLVIYIWNACEQEQDSSVTRGVELWRWRDAVESSQFSPFRGVSSAISPYRWLLYLISLIYAADEANEIHRARSMKPFSISRTPPPCGSV